MNEDRLHAAWVWSAGDVARKADLVKLKDELTVKLQVRELSLLWLRTAPHMRQAGMHSILCACCIPIHLL